MKALLYCYAIFGLLLAGCGQKANEEKSKQTTNTSAQAAAPAGGNPITAPVDYLGAVGQAKIASEKTLDTVGINQAIQMFNVQEGRYPKDLNELVEKQFLRTLPEPPYGMRIVYDPVNGTVKILRK